MLELPNKIEIVLLLLIMVLSTAQPTQTQQMNKQTEYIQEFAKTMSDFIPTQTFTFETVPNQQQNFALWPGHEIQKVRGVFYVDNSQDPDNANGQGFFVGCEVNGIMQKTFVDQRLGVFTLMLEQKPSNVRLVFKSDHKPMTIYVSYQLKKQQFEAPVAESDNQNVPTEQQEKLLQKKSQLDQVTLKFAKVETTVQSQENSLRMILKHIGRHSTKLQRELKYAHYRIILETTLVLLSGLFGMWIIRKQMKSGYQLLV